MAQNLLDFVLYRRFLGNFFFIDAKTSLLSHDKTWYLPFGTKIIGIQIGSVQWFPSYNVYKKCTLNLHFS